MKKLYRSTDNKMVAGVIGGLGEYFAIDPTILRLVFIILLIITGVFPGVLLYIVGIFLIPQKGSESVAESIIHDAEVTADAPKHE